MGLKSKRRELIKRPLISVEILCSTATTKTQLKRLEMIVDFACCFPLNKNLLTFSETEWEETISPISITGFALMVTRLYLSSFIRMLFPWNSIRPANVNARRSPQLPGKLYKYLRGR